MKNHIVRQFFVIFTTIFTLVMNGAANAIPLNGRGTGEISDSFKVLFVPAGYVFAIWGVIYIGLIAYTIYHSLPSQRNNPLLIKTGWLVVLSNLANGSWIYFWHYGYYAITLVIMIILLVSLLLIYLRLNIGKTLFSRADKWLISIPFSLYLGWITVATIANATALLSYIGWNGWGVSDVAWTISHAYSRGSDFRIDVIHQVGYRLFLGAHLGIRGISVRWMNLMPLNIAGFTAAGLVLLLLLLSRTLPICKKAACHILRLFR